MQWSTNPSRALAPYHTPPYHTPTLSQPQTLLHQRGLTPKNSIFDAIWPGGSIWRQELACSSHVDVVVALLKPRPPLIVSEVMLPKGGTTFEFGTTVSRRGHTYLCRQILKPCQSPKMTIQDETTLPPPTQIPCLSHTTLTSCLISFFRHHSNPDQWTLLTNTCSVTVVLFRLLSYPHQDIVFPTVPNFKIYLNL